MGTTTIGRILADRRGWPFFDPGDEIERHFGKSIERLQTRFLTGYSYRKECAVVLERIATANSDCVISLPPSGLRDAFLRVVRRVPGVAIHDTPEHILERITFYDIDSRRTGKHLTDGERILQLKEAAPLKPLPELVGLEHYRVRRQARIGGLINEYRLVA